MNAAIKTSADNITSEVSKTYSTKEEVSNIQVGGRNLWVISDLVNGYTSMVNPMGSIVAVSNDIHKIVKTLKETGENKNVIVQLWNPNKVINTGNTNRIVFFDSENNFISQVQTIN